MLDTVKGSFVLRTSKTIRDERNQFSGDRKMEPPFGWFSLSNDILADKKGEKGRGKNLSGQMFRISRRDSEGKTRKAVFRFLKMNPLLGKEQMLIDWDAQKLLNNEKKYSVDLEIRKAKWFELPKAYLSDPDPIRRVSATLGMLSLFLGILSIVLSVLFAFK